jgi:ribosomal protein L3 glutamine methyltransferase
VPARGARGPRAGSRPATVAALVRATEARLRRARLCYGHGTDNPRDEAAALVFHAAGYGHRAAPEAYGWPVSKRAQRTLSRLLARRIRDRVPAAYLTGRTWFAGHEIRVDRGVLIPRSPLGEFILERGAPFLHAARVRRILDLGTGSGCIAIACAHAFPKARVDASDVAPRALALARANVRRHRLAGRVRVVRADVYSGLGRRRYDMIISNPPYVPAGEVSRLPAEYGHEPRAALAAGPDGLAVVTRILLGAAAHLTPGGVLVVEVGDSEGAVAAQWPFLPLLWLEFARGGGGVFLITSRDLERAHARLARRA